MELVSPKGTAFAVMGEGFQPNEPADDPFAVARRNPQGDLNGNFRRHVASDGCSARRRQPGLRIGQFQGDRSVVRAHRQLCLGEPSPENAMRELLLRKIL